MVNNTTTDELGTCTINGVSEGSLTITISKEGYVTKNETINVTKNETLNFTLEEEEVNDTILVSFLIIGRGETSSSPLSGAKILIDGEIEKYTGSAGGCTQELTSGAHTFEVSCEGYVTKTETMPISKEDYKIQIALNPI